MTTTAVKPVRNLADIEAIEREMPWTERITARSTYDILRDSAAKYGDRTAIHFLVDGRADGPCVQISYRALFARVTQAANLFHRLGVRPGGPSVAYILPNLPQTHFTIWGGQAAGIVTAINPLLDPVHIAEILEAADARVLVALGPVPGADLWDKVQAVRKLYPALDHVLTVGAPADGAADFDAAVAAEPADRLVSGRRIDPEDICAYFHTGGTTGAPKLARHLHRGEVFEAWAIRHLADFQEGDRVLLGLPLFHVNAVIVTGLAPFVAGAETVILSPAGYRNPAVIGDFWKIVAKFRATTFSSVPTILAALLNVPMTGCDVSSLRYVICGAAPCPVELFTAFETATGLRILEGYGMTEGTCASSINPRDGQSKVGSVGIRFPYQPLKTVKIDANGQYAGDCGTDEVGVVTYSGPNVFAGYKQDKHNKTAFVQPGWVNTGDLGRIDADGYLWLVGRAKDLIIRGGHNIDPGQIEEVLHQHPAVALAAAIGRPDAYAGEVPIAYVELKPGATASADEIRDFARDRVLERPAAPAEILVVDRIPVTAVGKIFKPTLRYDATARVFRAALAELAANGIAIAVEVAPHDKHGTVATVTVSGVAASEQAALAHRIDHVLAPFTVRHETIFT